MPDTRISYLDGRARQPEALERIAAHVADRLDALRRAGSPLTTVTRPLLVGMGASHAALALPAHLGGSRRELASEALTAGGAPLAEAELVVGVSQSGRSAETLDALQAVPRERRAAVVNLTPSRLADAADHVLDLGGEPDSYASTIGYTGTLIALASAARVAAGADPARAAEEWTGIRTLLTRFEERSGPAVEAFAARAAGAVAADVVAAGADRGTAEEGALLLREVCRVPAAAAVTRNHLHGEMESAGGTGPTLHVVIGDGREAALARSLAAAGHATLCLTAAPVEPSPVLTVVPMPAEAAASAPVRAILHTAVLQRLAGALAGERGVAIEEFVFENDDTKVGEPA